MTDERITQFHKYLKAKSEAFDAGWNDYTTLIEFERVFGLATTKLIPAAIYDNNNMEASK